MAEQTFRSPGFFEREIDLTARKVEPTGTPAGIIGTAEKGPAFVPVTVGSFADFRTKFGNLDPKRFGPYAVNEFLKSKQALTYLRVLGAGANESTNDVSRTQLSGRVRNAGFVVTGAIGGAADDQRYAGSVQFIVARHRLPANEIVGYPLFSDNQSYVADESGETVNLIRAVLFTARTARVRVIDGGATLGSSLINDGNDTCAMTDGEFLCVISSSLGTAFSNDSSFAGIKSYTVSLDPTSASYIGKVLNTDPDKFLESQHLLYMDLAVDSQIAIVDETVTASVAVVSGSTNTSSTSGDTSLTFRDAFGHFDTRYQTPRTTSFISQPFGGTEYDLFHFETLDDGEYANSKYKVSIANIQMSNDPANEYGTFAVQIRSFDDVDTDAKILEQFPVCSLNPKSENYVAKIVGDYRVRFNFDAEQEEERRLIVSGKYPNRSKYVRVVMNDSVDRMLVPARSLPFGFRGVPVLKTSFNGTDGISGTDASRLSLYTADVDIGVLSALTGAIVPPVPFRFKVTRGTTKTTSPSYAGEPGPRESIDSRLYWGVKFERNVDPTNVNATDVANACVAAYTKLAGIEKLDVLLTGSYVDSFNDNKFTLARVALSASSVTNSTYLAATADDVMRETAYVRHGTPSSTDYTVNDGVGNRITLATLAAQTSSVQFNRFTSFAKFTNIFYGGFDGVNILDKNAARLNDKSAANSGVDAGAVSTTTGAFAMNQAGTGKANNSIASYVAATKIMTDPLTTNINILSIPGIREPYVTDAALKHAREYGQALCVLDLEERDDSDNRLFDDSTSKPDVRKTREAFESRAIDNNYGATYFPNVVINDADNNRRVEVPASVAALAALGYNDKVAYPWFAPAGFNRAALDFVLNVDVRLNAEDRNTLYDARINPIATFPNQGGQSIVIFGQKTLQQAHTALDRVNVRRLMLELKRLVGQVALRIVFEQNNAATRAKFAGQIIPLLAIVQSQAGIEKFKVVVDETNNTTLDEEQNKMNGRIIVVPTRAVEYIAIDFIITNVGVSFA